MPSLFVSIRYVNLLFDVAEHYDIPRESLCRRAGVATPPAEGSDVRIPADDYYDLWKAAMDALKDPSLPVRVAKRMNASSFDVLGFAMLTSGNLDKTMRLIQRYQSFVTNAAQWEIHESSDAKFFAPRLLGPPRPEHRYVQEFTLAHIILMARAFTGTDMRPVEVCYASAEPADTTAQHSLFRAPIRFGSLMSGLRISREALELPFLKADTELAAHFESHLDKAITTVPQSLTAMVRRQIAESLPRQDWSLERVARQLSLSSRSLRRHLKEEGVSFLELLDETRASMAKRHLYDGVSTGDIAFILGYSEPSAFYRAFRRWTGMTPEEYRARSRTGVSAP